MTSKSPLRHLLEYILFLPIKEFLLYTPASCAYVCAKILGKVVYRVAGIRQRVVMQNLATAFGEELSPQRLRQIARQSYEHIALTFTEFVRMERWATHKTEHMITEIEGKKYLEEAGGTEKSWIGLSAHIGNWEAMAAHFVTRGYNLMVVAKKIHNPYINKWIARVRKSRDYKVTFTKSDVREILRHLKKGGLAAFLVDQDARHTGIFADFFNKPAATHTGPAVLSLRLNLPIVPIFDVRLRPEQHKMVIMPPIYPPKDIPREEAIRWITREHLRAVEQIVKRYPEQYFWLHKRWKTQPQMHDTSYEGNVTHS